MAGFANPFCGPALDLRDSGIVVRFLFVFIVISRLALQAATGATAAGGITHPDPARLEGEIRKFELIDLRTPPPLHPVLFTGSSSVRLWTNLTADFPSRAVLNRGFGGSQMSDLVYFFDRVVRPYKPSMIVVYEGDNDLAGGNSVETVYGEFLLFLRRVRTDLPGTPVVILATKPSPSRLKLLASQRDLDTRLETLAQSSPGVFFIDTFHPLLDASGVPRPEYYLDDNLHLTPAGYAVWQRVVEAALNRMLPTEHAR